ncbi:phosphoribosylanthranilate isomerase [Flaviaesturariibacter aridisoli]|uniref:N-(5'-phosphoribosyl)anthranilate isomerase n=1 Tax=Flaviaesturariibacter aridisoli TaxID=2545761 RepID=A0A4R4DZT9_9BACT|nr:phosphoribosylanthranilate isomerase [Flaviaesturariibacter aridisoli]TCZ68277.1 phosphoribosylanthranilate isomerase [Flaviaesturariibacter aridisoli]
MKLKVCGLTSTDQMQEAYEMGVDYVGLVLYPGSKRSALPLVERERTRIRDLQVPKIGVFVNETYDNVLRLTEELDLTAVQLHGNETPEFCHGLQERVNIIKAFQISADTDIDTLVKPYQKLCNYYLFDTASAGWGGSGTGFDWNILETALVDKLFFLSGGIGPEDPNRIREFYHPFHYGIDINSRFETAPGTKDMKLVQQFLSDLNANEPGRVQET